MYANASEPGCNTYVGKHTILVFMDGVSGVSCHYTSFTPTAEGYRAADNNFTTFLKNITTEFKENSRAIAIGKTAMPLPYLPPSLTRPLPYPPLSLLHLYLTDLWAATLQVTGFHGVLLRTTLRASPCKRVWAGAICLWARRSRGCGSCTRSTQLVPTRGHSQASIALAMGVSSAPP